MRFEQKLTAALALLASTGIKRGSYAPPLFRLLWRMGIKIPPPHFAGFATNVVSSGPFFGITWGLLMWFALWSHQRMPLGVALGAATLAGLLFGLSMAGYYRYGARKHSNPFVARFSTDG